MSRGHGYSQAAERRAVGMVREWFRKQGWNAFRYQQQTWKEYLQGKSGLVHSTTGTGKTLAVWMGPVVQILAESEQNPAVLDEGPIRILWITPLRALAADTAASLQFPLHDLGIRWQVGRRTGDTPAAERQRQRERLPRVLVTTPESLSLLLTRSDAGVQFRELRAVICDEWHELLATKRGVQVELALARLRRWRPELQTWGLSATLGNLNDALTVLLGHGRCSDEFCEPAEPGAQAASVAAMAAHTTGSIVPTAVPGSIVKGESRKRIVVDSLIPEEIERFPWAGHLGMAQLPDVIAAVDEVRSTLIFTNTRSQTEAWYHALLKARPDWAGRIALHHGSLEQGTRTWVEDGLRDGRLRAVVCTSSLDLGVDFSPVDRVLQIGSPRGVARLLQRAGRSGHQPGATSRVTCVPTHALELVEAAAARDAIARGQLEGREPHACPIDVLCQHLVTIGVGDGFDADDLYREVLTTASFASLSPEDWQWALDFTAHGGEALQAYPDYHRLKVEDGRYRIASPRAARQHRMSIGTITSDAALTVQFLNGPKLGTIEESFLGRIAPGDRFLFAGRAVELVHIHDLTVWVRRAKSSRNARVPRWMGGRMPLSSELAEAVRRKLEQADDGVFDGPEMRAVRPLLELQASWSVIPRCGQLLIEQIHSREGWHLLFYPFAGRLVHEGLSTLIGWRLSQLMPLTFTMSVNDYGFELLSAKQAPLTDPLQTGLFQTETLGDDLLRCLNAAEMGRRQFREIARISGLVFQGYPGQQKTARQLQASSSLLYDVFTNYDPQNRLLQQASREVLERQLEHTRMVATLRQMQQMQVVLRQPSRLTPLAFPLVVARLRERLSSEKLLDRIARMKRPLEKAADSRRGSDG